MTALSPILNRRMMAAVGYAPYEIERLTGLHRSKQRQLLKSPQRTNRNTYLRILALQKRSLKDELIQLAFGIDHLYCDWEMWIERANGHAGADSVGFRLGLHRLIRHGGMADVLEPFLDGLLFERIASTMSFDERAALMGLKEADPLRNGGKSPFDEVLFNHIMMHSGVSRQALLSRKERIEASKKVPLNAHKLFMELFGFDEGAFERLEYLFNRLKLKGFSLYSEYYRLRSEPFFDVQTCMQYKTKQSFYESLITFYEHHFGSFLKGHILEFYYEARSMEYFYTHGKLRRNNAYREIRKDLRAFEEWIGLNDMERLW